MPVLRWVVLLLGCFVWACSGNGNGNGDGNGGTDADDGNGGGDEVQHSWVMYLDDSALVDAQVTFQKGRCVGKVTINAKTGPALQAVEAFARHLAEPIALDGSTPASDRELTELSPVPPLPGELSGWLEDTSDGIDGPLLVTSNAYDWINGAAAPFEDNGFEAVIEEYYLHDSEGWSLDFDLVNQGSLAGAQAAFDQAEWDSGTQIEP